MCAKRVARRTHPVADGSGHVAPAFASAVGTLQPAFVHEGVPAVLHLLLRERILRHGVRHRRGGRTVLRDRPDLHLHLLRRTARLRWPCTKMQLAAAERGGWKATRLAFGRTGWRTPHVERTRSPCGTYLVGPQQLRPWAQCSPAISISTWLAWPKLQPQWARWLRRPPSGGRRNNFRCARWSAEVRSRCRTAPPARASAWWIAELRSWTRPPTRCQPASSSAGQVAASSSAGQMATIPCSDAAIPWRPCTVAAVALTAPLLLLVPGRAVPASCRAGGCESRFSARRR